MFKLLRIFEGFCKRDVFWFLLCVLLASGTEVSQCARHVARVVKRVRSYLLIHTVDDRSYTRQNSRKYS